MAKSTKPDSFVNVYGWAAYRISAGRCSMSHSHHGCGGHHHHDEQQDPAVLWSLYKKIDLHKVQCMNESEDGSGKEVFKAWERRLDRDKFVESDCDEELLFYVPFTGDVKLKALRVIGGDSGQHPLELRLYKNRPPMGFDELASEADQVIQLSKDPNGEVEYTVKASKFSSVQSLLLHFSSNYGADSTVIYYVGFQGEFKEAHRHEVTICTYEARPNPADHKVNNFNPAGNIIS